jgi:hypothetical protein
VTTPIFPDTCLVFALHREAGPFFRSFPPHQGFPSAPCRARFCGVPPANFLVLETGLGAAALEKGLAWLLGSPPLGNVPYRPKRTLLAGFSGALQEGLNVGDLILATEFLDPKGERWPATWLPPSDWQPGIRRGRLLTTAHLISDPEEKRRLGRQYDALAVDMESAVAARLCHRHGVPFGCLRVISDDWDTPISPRLVDLLRHGRVALPRLLAAVLRSPRLVREMWQLARHTRIAAQQLGRGLGEWMRLVLV